MTQRSASIQVLSAGDIARYIPEVADLRIRVFREFPYLYDGDAAYEARYLQRYVQASGSVLVLAQDGRRVVGASTGMPLIQDDAAFQRPFRDRGYELASVFYCGE